MDRTGGMILGTGSLGPPEDGVRPGIAKFPVRGEFPIALDLPRKDGPDRTVARLRVGNSETTVEYDRQNGWWVGEIPVDGYLMAVVVDSRFNVEFLDV